VLSGTKFPVTAFAGDTDPTATLATTASVNRTFLI